MKHLIPILFFAVFIIESATGAQPLQIGLPPVEHADTETTTNVPFSAALSAAGRFSFVLSCRATPSNNVEVAFGTDDNANGVLDLNETDRVVGWDCGAWFTRRGADGVLVAEVTSSTNDIQSLVWDVKTDRDGTPSRLTVRTDGQTVFGTLPTELTYRRSWNLLRLTGRGQDTSLENFSVVVTPDGMSIIMR